MKLKVGFIGIGAMGRSHVQQFHVKQSARAEATAICSTNENNIRQALEIAPAAKVFAQADELIAAELDAIVVSSPNSTHLPLASKILAAGKHLFLEKPCGITREEAAELLRLAETTDRVVMIGHELRYSPFFQKIKQLIDTGEIGQPRMVWTREFRGPFQPKSGDWIQDERLSGGMMVDKNCHHFDLMNWWAGARPQRVAAFGGLAVNPRIAGAHQVNDHSVVSFEYANGVHGSLQICLFAHDFPHEDLEMGVVGDTGALQTRISQVEILQWKRGLNQKEPIVHKITSNAGEGWGNHLGFDEIHAAFLDAVLDGKPVLTNVRECLDGTLLAIAAEESIKTGTIVELS